MRTGLFIVSLLLMTYFLNGYAREMTRHEQRQEQQATLAETKESYLHKDDYLKQTNAELKKLKKEIARLEKKSEQANNEAKEEARERVQAVKERFGKLGEKIEELKRASESTWEDVKRGYNKSVNEFKNAIDKSRTWMSEKIAP